MASQDIIQTHLGTIDALSAIVKGAPLPLDQHMQLQVAVTNLRKYVSGGVPPAASPTPVAATKQAKKR